MIASNKTLIKKLKRDDHRAFEQLFHLYASKIHNFSYKFLNDTKEAEEIVQIVFIAVWENREEIDENRSFLTYIFTIARNHIFNHLKKKTHLQAFVNFVLHQQQEYNFVTDDQVIFNEQKKILDRCIEELPPKRREVFLLSRKDGLTYKEIARQLNITESTVNTQITKSIEFLRKKIIEQGH